MTCDCVLWSLAALAGVTRMEVERSGGRIVDHDDRSVLPSSPGPSRGGFAVAENAAWPPPIPRERGEHLVDAR